MRVLSKAISKFVAVDVVAFEDLDIEELHFLNNRVQISGSEEILDSEHHRQDIVHQGIRVMKSSLLYDDHTFVDLVDDLLERVLLLLLLVDLLFVGLNKLLHHEVVDQKGHNGAREDRSYLSYLPEGGDTGVEVAEDQN